MCKQEFLENLKAQLQGLPKRELEDRLAFYGELIEDGIEEGYSEEESVAKIGSVDEVVSKIIEEVPLSTLLKDKVKPKRKFGTWEIVCLVVGSPIWISLLASAFAVAFSLYLSVWAIIVSLWSVFVSLAACAVGLLIGSIVFTFTATPLNGLVVFSVSLFSGGLSLFLWYACKAITKGFIRLTKKSIVKIKYRFVKKEEL